MKRYFSLFWVLGFLASSSLSLACPGNTKCEGTNCQCQGNSCNQENPAPKKDKKAKNSKKGDATPSTAATPSH